MDLGAASPILSVGLPTVTGMRILHTGDWHLGRTLHGVDLLEAQATFIDHLVATVAAEAVDLVVVAGDVYDRAIPPVEAVGLLESALARLCERAHVLVLSGNHDSGTRLGFGSALFTPRLHVRTDPSTVGVPLELVDEHGPVLVHAIPYLDPDVVRHTFAGSAAAAADAADVEGAGGADGGEPARPEPLARSHEAVMSEAVNRVRRSTRAWGAEQDGARPRSVVVAHAFVVGGEACESERDIRVGGVDAVPSGVFDGLDYVALGHLHRAQRVGSGDGGTVLRYSGSPLAYSFSEAEHRKSSWLVDLGPSGVRGVEAVVAPVSRRLSTLRGPLESVLGPLGEGHDDDWLRVLVTDERRPTELVARVRARFPHALVVVHEPASSVPAQRAGLVGAHSDPLEVAREFLAFVGGGEPSPAELDVLRGAYEAVLAGQRSA